MGGYFIVLEGIDETVLSDQALRLQAWLKTQGQRAVITCEPGDGPVGGQLHLVHSGRLQLNIFSQAILQVANRLDHLKRPDGILADLAQGRVVICIHYLLADYATRDAQVSLDWLMQINQLCPWPNLTIFIDSPPTQSVQEAQQANYHSLMQITPPPEATLASVDGQQSAENIFLALRHLISPVG